MLRPSELRGIVPVAVDLWEGQRIPENLIRLRQNDRVHDADAFCTMLDSSRPVEIHQIDGMTVQLVVDDRPQRMTVFGRLGCINQLRSVLERSRGGNCSLSLIAREIGGGIEANSRMLHRLNAGGRVGAGFIVKVARQYGLRPEDLAFLHTYYERHLGEACPASDTHLVRRKKRRGKNDPFAALRREREVEELEALRAFPVSLHGLVDDPIQCNELARDLFHDLTQIHIDERWRNAAGSEILELTRGAKATQRLLQLIHRRRAVENLSERQLSMELQSCAVDLRATGVAVSVGRYVGITRTDPAETDHHYNDSVRHVVIQLGSRTQGVHTIDLRKDQALRPSARELDLSEEATIAAAALRSIRRDIDWCGHWEGAWIRFWPPSAPPWLKALTV
jgi:hypothetical protein